MWAVTGILFSAFCWYLSDGLNGDFWYLLWIAPVPVLLISFRTNGTITFIISFIAYLLGRLSWFSYLAMVATLVPAIIITLTVPLFFAIIMVITRRIVVKTGKWYSVFVFPVFFTAYEFLLMKFSADGTAGSIAYSQSNFLPVVQVASLTGLSGITFLLGLLPSFIATSWHFRKHNAAWLYFAGIPALILIAALLFGIFRLSSRVDQDFIKAGLVVLPEKSHFIADQADMQKDIPVAEMYAGEIASLAAQGADLVVLPERAVNVNKTLDTAIIKVFRQAAIQNHVFIVLGYTNTGGDQEYNSALILNKEGETVADYNKVHLVTGFERQFTPGKETGLFNFRSKVAGVAICKDLDFQPHIREYGKKMISFLCIPAWDFVKDDWLHSRMAIIRGVENGFSEIRCARKGRLTISDCYGRVPFEANASDGHKKQLLGEVSMHFTKTLYTRLGDWFGKTILIAALYLIYVMIRTWRREDLAQIP